MDRRKFIATTSLTATAALLSFPLVKAMSEKSALSRIGLTTVVSGAILRIPHPAICLSGRNYPWEIFLETCKEIGYDGVLSHEQCSPIVMKGHQLGDIAEVDKRYQEAIAYLKPLVKKLSYYTGHK